MTNTLRSIITNTNFLVFCRLGVFSISIMRNTSWREEAIVFALCCAYVVLANLKPAGLRIGFISGLIGLNLAQALNDKFPHSSIGLCVLGLAVLYIMNGYERIEVSSENQKVSAS